MTQYRNTGAGGTAGVAISGSNMGGSSGDQPTALLIDGGSAVVFDTAHASRAGYESFHVTPTASPGHDYIQYGGLTATGLASRQYVYFTSNPGAGGDMVIDRHFGPTTNVAILKFISTGALRIVDNAGATIWTSGSAFPLSQIIRVDFFTDTTADKVKAAWSVLDAAPSVDSTLLTMVGGGSAAVRSDLGKVSGVYATDFWFGDVAVDDAATDYIPAGPSVTALTATQVVVPSTATIPFTATATVTATGGTGTVKNYSWA